MNIRLSICIPTYNRAKMLQGCLTHLLPQLADKRNVELVVCDNFSADDTESIVKGYLGQYDNIRYFKNPRNLGYVGNQIKCFEHARGDYIAILCDDDVYLEGQVNAILKAITGRNYVLVYLNYYSFIKEINKVHGVFAPEEDVFFARAYDIMNYPSVGHFSGYIFNASVAKETLNAILAKGNHEILEKQRGIISQTAIRATANSKLPAYFIGKRRLAGRMPVAVGYDSLRHQCLEYYRDFIGYHQEGIINADDLEYRAKLVLARLPRAIVADGPRISNHELIVITKELSSYFGNKKKYYLISKPLLVLARCPVVKWFFCVLKKVNRLRKQLRNTVYG